VLVKASGDLSVGDNPAVRVALEQADRYLLGYRYEETALGEQQLRLDYDEDAVQRLMRDAGHHPLDGEPPDDSGLGCAQREGRRQFLTPDTDPLSVQRCAMPSDVAVCLCSCHSMIWRMPRRFPPARPGVSPRWR
jgi:hypothetical protein